MIKVQCIEKWEYVVQCPCVVNFRLEFFCNMLIEIKKVQQELIRNIEVRLLMHNTMKFLIRGEEVH